VDVGDFASSGAAIALVAQTPLEGAGYKVAGSAPLYADGGLGAAVAPSGSATATATAEPLTVGSGAVSAALTAAVTQRVPSFDRGELLLSHDGALVDAVSLQSALGAPPGTITNLTIENLPGGKSTATLASGLYYVSIRVWSSANPTQTFHRAAFAAPVDLRNASAATISLPIN